MKMKLVHPLLVMAVILALENVSSTAQRTTPSTPKPKKPGPHGLNLNGKMFTLSLNRGGISFYPPSWPSTPSSTTSPYYTNTPPYTRKHPYTTTQHYPTTSKYHFTTTKRPYTTTRHPYTSTKQPYTRHPYTSTKQPYTRHPYTSTKQPYTRHPYTSTKQPYTRHPYTSTKQPYTRHPYTSTKQPYTRHPYTSTKHPYTRQPYTTTKHPYTRHPYTSTKHPYTRHPYTTTKQPYTTTKHPYTRHPYTTTTPPSARGVSVCLRYLSDFEETRIFTVSPSSSPLQMTINRLGGYALNFNPYGYDTLYLKPNVRFWSNIGPDIWSRVCFTVDSMKNVAQVFSGSNISIRKVIPYQYVWSGEPVIEFPGFDGQVTDVQMWDYPLSYREVFKYMTNGVRGPYRGSVLTWSSISYTPSGNTLLEDVYEWQTKQKIIGRRGRRPKGGRQNRKFVNEDEREEGVRHQLV